MKKEWKEMYTKGYSKKSVTNLNSCRIMQTVTLIFFNRSFFKLSKIYPFSLDCHKTKYND